MDKRGWKATVSPWDHKVSAMIEHSLNRYLVTEKIMYPQRENKFTVIKMNK